MQQKCFHRESEGCWRIEVIGSASPVAKRNLTPIPLHLMAFQRIYGVVMFLLLENDSGWATESDDVISLTKSPGDHQILQDDEDIPWWGTGVPVRHWQSWQGFKLSGVQDGDLCAVKIGQLSWDPAANDGWSCWNFQSGWVRIAYSCLSVYHPETSTNILSKPDQFV